MPSAAAARTASSMRTVPSAIENSLCRRRWTKPGDDMRRDDAESRTNFYSRLIVGRIGFDADRCHSASPTMHNSSSRVTHASHSRLRRSSWRALLAGCATCAVTGGPRTAGGAAPCRPRRTGAADAAQCRAAAAADQPVGLPAALSARLCGWLRERDRRRAQGCVAFRRRSELPYGLAGRNRALQEEIASPSRKRSVDIAFRRRARRASSRAHVGRSARDARSCCCMDGWTSAHRSSSSSTRWRAIGM